MTLSLSGEGANCATVNQAWHHAFSISCVSSCSLFFQMLGGIELRVPVLIALQICLIHFLFLLSHGPILHDLRIMYLALLIKSEFVKLLLMPALLNVYGRLYVKISFSK